MNTMAMKVSRKEQSQDRMEERNSKENNILDDQNSLQENWRTGSQMTTMERCKFMREDKQNNDNNMMNMPSIADITNSMDLVRLVRERLFKGRHSLLLSPEQFQEELDLTTQRFLGQGAFGSVSQCSKRRRVGQCTQQQYVALKSQRYDSQDSDEGITATLTEAYVLSEARHPTLVKCHGLQLEQYPRKIIMELGEGGSLGSVIKKHGQVKIGSQQYKMYLEYLLDIAEGLVWLESQQIVHRDLRPDNVVLFVENVGGQQFYRAKLIDFGLCKYIGVDDILFSILTKKNVGWACTPYQAPEELQGKQDVNCKADIYSFGVMVYELLQGQRPFQRKFGNNDFAVIDQVVKGGREDIPSEWPPQLAKIVKKCWEQDPEKRPTAVELYNMVQDIISGGEEGQGVL
eukprot:TRINITY_DN2436_c0_g1_i13.p1 TRINITY_DN2436_c0_g1~~TRINITY_DN2436_c0_g1_i13.p1  ORF type:complete len:402 (+),score=56.92 TRINITY_DN2436_c0_g1_i13:803-2008(+)